MVVRSGPVSGLPSAIALADGVEGFWTKGVNWPNDGEIGESTGSSPWSLIE
jgi:hypothetical protein